MFLELWVIVVKKWIMIYVGIPVYNVSYLKKKIKYLYIYNIYYNKHTVVNYHNFCNMEFWLLLSVKDIATDAFFVQLPYGKNSHFAKLSNFNHFYIKKENIYIIVYYVPIALFIISSSNLPFLL